MRRSIVFSGSFTAGRREISVDDGRLAITRDGTIPKFVEQVSSVTFSGKRALRQGQKVLYVTERCVIELRADGLTIVEIAPGVDLEADVLAKAAFRSKSPTTCASWKHGSSGPSLWGSPW